MIGCCLCVWFWVCGFCLYFYFVVCVLCGCLVVDCCCFRLVGFGVVLYLVCFACCLRFLGFVVVISVCFGFLCWLVVLLFWDLFVPDLFCYFMCSIACLVCLFWFADAAYLCLFVLVAFVFVGFWFNVLV